MKLINIDNNLKTKSYYKYFNNPKMKKLTDGEISLLTSCQSPEEGLEFKNRALLQDRDFEDENSGYYLLKDGGILFSCTTETPDLTGDMINWWFLWHQFDQLRYALWNTEDHKDIKIIPQNLKKFQDKSIPFSQRLWDTHSYPTESMNGEAGGDMIDIHFVDPQTQGFDDSKIGTDGCLAMVVAPGSQKHGDAEIPIFMTEELRKNKDGKNIWVARWWLGCGTKDGKDIIADIPAVDKEQMAKAGSILVAHSRKEMTQLNKVLPLLYKEYGKKDLADD